MFRTNGAGCEGVNVLVIHKGKKKLFRGYCLLMLCIASQHLIFLANKHYTLRDLTFGIFCEGNESDNTATEASKGNNDENQWSIPGVHTPTAMMIHSWLRTCAAWPIIKEFNDNNIPYHFEEISETPVDSRTSQTDENDGPPPTEIVFQVNVNSLDLNNASTDIEGEVCNGVAAVEPPRYRKFSYWGDLVHNQADWWYTLRVLRDCSDLVSAGWCPPPSGEVGEGIILRLISIAEKGITHLSGYNETKIGLSEQQIQKERLVACSCSSESLVAMKTLASREVIPQGALHSLAISLCQLISAAESPLSSSCQDSGSDDVEEKENALFEKEILTQRTFVASQSAELLWVLLSTETTSCPTTDALLDAIDINLSAEITDDNRSQAEECIVIACGAIRALSAAMWGKTRCLILLSSL